MEEHGKVIYVSPIREGVSKSTGEVWKSLQFVLEMDGRYTRRVCFSLFGEHNVEKANLQLGEYITVRAEVEAHLYQNKWFNEIRVWDILKNGFSQLRGDAQPIQLAPDNQAPAQESETKESKAKK